MYLLLRACWGFVVIEFASSLFLVIEVCFGYLTSRPGILVDGIADCRSRVGFAAGWTDYDIILVVSLRIQSHLVSRMASNGSAHNERTPLLQSVFSASSLSLTSNSASEPSADVCPESIDTYRKDGRDEEAELLGADRETDSGKQDASIGRIILVLLIGTHPVSKRISKRLIAIRLIVITRGLCFQRRRQLATGHSPHHRLRIQRPVRFELAGHELWSRSRCDPATVWETERYLWKKEAAPTSVYAVCRRLVCSHTPADVEKQLLTMP